MAEPNWGVFGHNWAVEMLRQHIARGSLRHAYLFTGPPGVGRRTLALHFAQAVNCPQPLALGEPCGACRTCRQIAAMQHADLSIVQAENEGGTLKVDQVRAVQHSLSLKPYQAPYRVALFLRFQEANTNAQNAMLKTLEEAPAHVILILTADNAEQLLPTIVSRCEILRLRPLGVEAVQTYLQSHGTEKSEAHLLAHLSDGRPGYALRLKDDAAALALRAEKLDDLKELLPANRRDKFTYAEKLARDKEVFRKTLLIWGSYWRDVLLKAAGANMQPTNIDRAEEIESLAHRYSLAEVRRVVNRLEETLERLEKNVNARLLAEVLMLDWPKT